MLQNFTYYVEMMLHKSTIMLQLTLPSPYIQQNLTLYLLWHKLFSTQELCIYEILKIELQVFMNSP